VRSRIELHGVCESGDNRKAAESGCLNDDTMKERKGVVRTNRDFERLYGISGGCIK